MGRYLLKMVKKNFRKESKACLRVGKENGGCFLSKGWHTSGLCDVCDFLGLNQRESMEYGMKIKSNQSIAFR